MFIGSAAPGPTGNQFFSFIFSAAIPQQKSQMAWFVEVEQIFVLIYLPLLQMRLWPFQNIQTDSNPRSRSRPLSHSTPGSSLFDVFGSVLPLDGVRLKRSLRERAREREREEEETLTSFSRKQIFGSAALNCPHTRQSEARTSSVTRLSDCFFNWATHWALHFLAIINQLTFLSNST